MAYLVIVVFGVGERHSRYLSYLNPNTAMASILSCMYVCTGKICVNLIQIKLQLILSLCEVGRRGGEGVRGGGGGGRRGGGGEGWGKGGGFWDTH